MNRRLRLLVLCLVALLPASTLSGGFTFYLPLDHGDVPDDSRHEHRHHHGSDHDRSDHHDSDHHHGEQPSLPAPLGHEHGPDTPAHVHVHHVTHPARADLQRAHAAFLVVAGAVEVVERFDPGAAARQVIAASRRPLPMAHSPPVFLETGRIQI